MVLQDSHIKLFLQYPEALQTLLIKNCVLLSLRNWSTGDLASLRRFAIQDSVVNFMGLLYMPFSEQLQEYTLLDTETR